MEKYHHEPNTRKNSPDLTVFYIRPGQGRCIGLHIGIQGNCSPSQDVILSELAVL